jgi:hypothetical protein
LHTRQSFFVAALLGALANPWPTVRLAAPPAVSIHAPQTSQGSGKGKGKGRYGARKPMQHVRTARPSASKPARRRRRATNLRRG